jgi:hypothetical protein
MAMNRTVSRVVARARLSLDRRPCAHFLHIGKTAGTAVKVALREAEGSAHYRTVPHRHEDHLSAIPETDYYFFCVRDPIARYVSGFLSRQREGLPRYHIPWKKGEAEAFAKFDTPDALAVALTAGGPDQQHAEAALGSIQHVRSSYWDWFGDPDYFKRRSDHILWIGHQESLDLTPLAATLGLERMQLPTDPARANKTDRAKPELSELARQNLRQWYAKDYQFLELCDELCPEGKAPNLDNPDANRTLVGRVMSGRPFALSNADALHLARVVRRRDQHS